MSSPNHSTCLIDLSGSNESPTSVAATPLMIFPPISVDEMIVPLKRFSISNDPFDTIEKQAKLFGDPFEFVNLSSSREAINAAVPTAKLVDFEGSGNSLQLSSDSQEDRSDTLNKAMCTISSITTNSSLGDANTSDPMNRAFVKSDSSISVQNSTNRNRILSDPVTSKPSKGKRKLASSKTRCASLEQLCLKNQLRKSLTNSPIGSPNWSKVKAASDSLDSSLFAKKSVTSDFNLTSESIFDDLLSTNPEWIESDNDDSDFERMTIPFLKNIQNDESTIPSSDCSSDRNTTLATIEKLSKFREVFESVADSPQSVATADDSKPLDERPPEDDITSIIETLRNAVKNCGDAKKKSEASVLLDNLNVCFKATTRSTTSTNSTTPSPPATHQFVRQRTFSVEDQLNGPRADQSPIAVTKELSNSMPFPSAQTRKSFSGSTSITPRRFSRSLTYTGKPVSVVTAVQIQSNSNERRRSSVCTTPTRLVRQTPTSNPKSTRTSLGRQSLSYSSDEKSVVKPVPRKTVMKTSNPIAASSDTRPLKLRVGEQTKSNGPMKAVIPYQRSSTLPDHTNEPSTKAKRTVKTSTPLAPNNIPKSAIPAASSTPVINTGKPPSLLQLRHAQSRLSYTPATPIATNFVNRQPCSERKKRSVTFREESDKLSQSMFVGAKDSTVQPVYPLQRRRLSQSFGTKKIIQFCRGNRRSRLLSISQRASFHRISSSISCDIFCLFVFLCLYFLVMTTVFCFINRKKKIKTFFSK